MIQRNRGKQKGKDQRSLQENWRYQRNISFKYGHNKGLNRSTRDEEMTKRHRRTVQEKILMTQIIMMVWSLTQSQTFWSVKSSGPQEALLSIKLVEVMEFQQSYLKAYKMMLLKCCTQYVSKFGKSSSGYRTGKGRSSSQFPRRAV